MAIPVPSAERSMKPKLWRAVEVKDGARNADLDRLFYDRRKREHDQDVMVGRPCGLLIPGATTPSARVLEKASIQERPVGKGHPLPPPIVEHPHRKRMGRENCKPLSEAEVMQKLWAPGGLSEPVERRKAASVMEMQKDRELAFQLSPQKPHFDSKKAFPELRAFQEERSRSSKGDASLAKTGVRKVDPRYASEDYKRSLPEVKPGCHRRESIIDRGEVQGFFGMRAFERNRNTGVKQIEPFSVPWDPLGFKARCDSGGHPHIYSGQP